MRRERGSVDVVSPASSRFERTETEEQACESSDWIFTAPSAWDDGKLKRLGRVDMRRHLLEAFAKKLTNEDVVVVEATGNAASVAAVLAPHVKKVVIVNPKRFASPLMRRSKPIRSTRKSSRSFMRAVFCRRSGFRMSRRRRFGGR